MKHTIFGLILAAASLGLMSASAETFKTLEDSGVEMIYSKRVSDISSHSITGIGMSWSVKAVGGTADFHIKHSTIAGASVEVNRSSTVYVLSGESVKDSFGGIVVNPVLLIERIDQPGCTVYVDIKYLKRREGWRF